MHNEKNCSFAFCRKRLKNLQVKSIFPQNVLKNLMYILNKGLAESQILWKQGQKESCFFIKNNI